MKPSFHFGTACSGWTKRHHFGRVVLTCLELRALGCAQPLCPVCELELRAVKLLVGGAS